MKEAIRFEKVTKIFGSVIANKDISFSVEKGKIYAILGENGSGKTTLMNMVAGIYKQDAGKIYINGTEATINSPGDAFDYHIGMIHQHFKLVDVFTAAENVGMGLTRKDTPEYKVLQQEIKEYGTEREILRKIKSIKKSLEDEELLDAMLYQNKLKEMQENLDIIRTLAKKEKKVRRYDLKTVEKKIKVITDRYGFVVDPKKHVYDMSVSEKQTLEIVKALNRGVDTLILDEPTAVLTPQETKSLFDALRNMREHGNTIIIITHKLNEVLEISDKVVILRKGEYAGEIETKKANEQKLTELMVGKKIELNIKYTKPKNVCDRMIIQNLTVINQDDKKAVDNMSFDVRAGEILGIAGISGNGQKELLESIAGLYPISEGKVTLINPKKDKPVTLFHKTIDEIKELAKVGTFHDSKKNEILNLNGLDEDRLLEIVANKGIVLNNGAIIDNQLPIKKLAKLKVLYTKNSRLLNLGPMTKKEITELVNNNEIIFNDDELVKIDEKDPLQIRQAGIHLAFVPEDRLGMGLVGNMSVTENMMLRTYKHGKGLFLHTEEPEKRANKVVNELGVVTPSINTAVRTLSGGNIQKILVGREIEFAPKVFMTAYPVRGLDINSSYTIYNLLEKLKREGVAVVYVGEDLDVLLELCDRVMVMCKGKNVGTFDRGTVDKFKVGLLMTNGDTKDEKVSN